MRVEMNKGSAESVSASARDRKRRTRELLAAYRATGERKHRNDLVELYLDLADLFACKYARRGATADDLRQVALVAMVRCVDRYDPDRDVEFSTFASRTIDGELKRHFRDKVWAVRPPRGLQELHLRVRAAQDDLTQLVGRVPTVNDIARYLDEDIDSVHAALEVSSRFYAASLDAPRSASVDDGQTLGEVALGSIDGEFDLVDTHDSLARVLIGLGEREQTILRLRFFENRSQEEIAAAVGVSQSYLSRLLRRTLDQLREQLEPAEAQVLNSLVTASA